MPRKTHQPRMYLCNKRTTKTCRTGFSTLSGLTRHRNKMHSLSNNRLLPALPAIPPPENSPPPDDMYVDDGENNPGPHEAMEDDVQTLRHPILNGMSFQVVHTFFVLYSSHSSRHAMRFPRKLPATGYSSSTLHLAWGGWCRTQCLGSIPRSGPI